MSKIDNSKRQNRPDWNGNLLEKQEYKLTPAEIVFIKQIKKKVSIASKNKVAAKEELTKINEKLKSGKIPREYSDLISHKLKKKDLKKELLLKAKSIYYPPVKVKPRENEKNEEDYTNKENVIKENNQRTNIKSKFIPLRKTANVKCENKNSELENDLKNDEEISIQKIDDHSEEVKKILNDEIKIISEDNYLDSESNVKFLN